MKTKILFISMFTLLSIGLINAQLKVKSTGRTIAGPEPADLINNDPDGIINLHVIGKGEVGSQGKIAFGDFGRAPGSFNVVVGEWDNYDSDRLWLHGKLGTYFTSNSSGTNIIAYYNASEGDMFKFNCDVYSKGVLLASDARFKTNVNKLDNSLSQLCKLNGVSYNLKPRTLSFSNNSLKSASASKNASLTEKEIKDKAYFESLSKKLEQNSTKRMGFIAQDLQKVFPDLVSTDSTGYMYVDYIGLVPIIVEALKEQQSTIETQNEKIKDLESKLSKMTGAANSSSIGQLFHNSPNPFNTNNEIKYYLPQSVINATLYIYDMQGSQVKSIAIQQRNNGSITINGSELKAGMYIYSLIADGKEVDTKRMILTQ
jgi:hypothetical protein